MSRTPRIAALILTTLTLLAATTLLSAQTPALPDISAPALAAYKQGIEAEGLQHFDVALDRLQAALKLAPNCLDCLEATARVYRAMGDDKAAIATLGKLASVSATPKTKAHADMLIGRLYYDLYFAYTAGGGAYDKNPKKAQDALKSAEAAIAHATQQDPNDEQALMLHAHLLAMLKRDAEASTQFVACAAIPGTSPSECARVLRLSKNIDLARNEPAPSFEATTIDGQKVSLASLTGKIVLIDFWGTWCPWCIRDADYVQSMLSTFPPDRFALLEVDSGDARDHWLKYVDQNRMKGLQAQDEPRVMRDAFRVNSYPTYVILDGDGTIRFRVSGARGDLRGEVRKLLAEPSTSTVASASPAPSDAKKN